jgi:signal transduction histidine kinase
MRRSLTLYAVRAVALAAVAAAVYAVVVLAIGHVPTAGQWTLLVFSTLAAAVVALIYAHLRPRLDGFAARLARAESGSPAEVLGTFHARLAHAIPLDELLLQVAESLRRSLGLNRAQLWTGSGGLFDRTVSDPDAGPGTLVLAPAEQVVLARGGVVGRAWLKVWVPQLLDGRDDAEVRLAPLTHSGELFGGILVDRPADAPFGDEDERVLATLARQVALALSNARLGSALEDSLDELRRQADELRASRARVVAAADAERRRIERDLHDGAQQHLIALAVNLRLARELAASDPKAAAALLEELSGDVQHALDDFRDLAHGIYPPLLVDRGLADGLRAALARSPVDARLELAPVRRYVPEVEATVYFCCLEALQNAGKHAGPDARATVRVWEDEGALLFEVGDDGRGFDAADGRGTGLAGMTDRVGALGGRLAIESSPGRGTRVSGAVPLATPRPPRTGTAARP